MHMLYDGDNHDGCAELNGCNTFCLEPTVQYCTSRDPNIYYITRYICTAYMYIPLQGKHTPTQPVL